MTALAQPTVSPHQVRLDQASVFLVSWTPNFRIYLKENNIETFGQLRAIREKLHREKDPPKGFACRSTQTLMMYRFGSEIYCRMCGAPMILFEATMLCEKHDALCAKSLPLPKGSTLRKAFPDRVSK